MKNILLSLIFLQFRLSTSSQIINHSQSNLSISMDGDHVNNIPAEIYFLKIKTENSTKTKK